MEDFKKLGICIKNQDKTVISQNEICKQCCGDMLGKVCDFGCMKDYQTNQPRSFSDGMTLMKNAENHLGKSDTVVINDGETITTIIYPKLNQAENINLDLKELENCNLTKSENYILELILSGKRNKEICKILFISEATLKTHLNNIYKKIPEHWQVLKKRFN
jgi:ribosomal protein L25 (general stress protein Ctc)